MVIRKQLTRPKLLPFVVQLAPCRIGMEAEHVHIGVPGAKDRKMCGKPLVQNITILLANL